MAIVWSEPKLAESALGGDFETALMESQSPDHLRVISKLAFYVFSPNSHPTGTLRPLKALEGLGFLSKHGVDTLIVRCEK